MSNGWKRTQLEEVIEQIKTEEIEFIIVATDNGIAVHAPVDVAITHIAFHLVMLLDGMQREIETRRTQAEQN